MRKVISLSALVSGLLAAPGLAAPLAPGVVRREAERAEVVAPEEPLSPEAQALLQAELAEMVEKGPEDVGGMRALQGRIARNMRKRLEGMQLAEGGKSLEGQVGDFPLKGEMGQQQLPSLVGQIRDSAALDPQRMKQAIEQMPAMTIPAGAFQQKMEKAAFLGVTASRAGEALEHQIGLAKGMGLVVDFVAKDSPAEAAGLQQHDVLTKLDDQLLVNLEQLAVLVRSKKPGDSVTLTIFRGGKEMKLTAKLVEKEVPAQIGTEDGTFEINPFPRAGNGRTGDNMDIYERDPGDGWHLRGQTTVTAEADGSMHGKFHDPENDIEMTRDKDGKTTVIAKDKAGKEIYNGGYNTAEEKEKVPAELRPKIERMEMQALAGAAAATKPGGANGQAPESVIVNRIDDEHEIVFTLNGGVRSVVVKDVKTGKEIYRGPGDTEEELKKMPASVAEKVKAIEAKVGVGRK